MWNANDLIDVLSQLDSLYLIIWISGYPGAGFKDAMHMNPSQSR